MTSALHPKLASHHLKRQAYLYVRQSTLRQVSHHTESTRRQYSLHQRALALGWGEDQIVVVDSDQGQSGSTGNRVGFQTLVSEVGMGRAGLVMGLEVSRLARNSADWHRLIEICALSDTLILDEDGLYDPAHFNDRLLLGLKGTMSEAELHMLRARLQGGLLNKARRGELIMALPLGFVYDEQCRVVLDPDLQVQQAIRALFSTFGRVGSASGTARAFRKEKILFPKRAPARGPRANSSVTWKELDVSTVLRTLQNPRYAGIYCYGKTRSSRTPEGRYVSRKRPTEEWHVWIPDAHAGYISQRQHEENLRRLAENAQAIGADRRSPPREGPGLLQGLVLCGKCGRTMRTRYHARTNGRLVPSYLCPRIDGPTCQAVHGTLVDQAVGELLVELMTPMTLEVSLSVQRELEERREQSEQLRWKQVERARYEAELARRRFLEVDPSNRLVAASLETEWNEKLQLLAAAEQEFQRRSAEDRKPLDTEQEAKILATVSDFSRLWNDPRTPARERKRIVRLLIEDVALHRHEREVTVRILFKTGATESLTVEVPRSAAELYRTDPEIIREIDRLLEHHTDTEIAEIFDGRGLLSSRGHQYTASTIAILRSTYKLESRFNRLQKRGYLRTKEVARKLDVSRKMISRWGRSGLLRAHYYGDTLYLYEDPTIGTDATPEELRERFRTALSEQTDQFHRNEVQYEA